MCTPCVKTGMNIVHWQNLLDFCVLACKWSVLCSLKHCGGFTVGNSETQIALTLCLCPLASHLSLVMEEHGENKSSLLPQYGSGTHHSHSLSLAWACLWPLLQANQRKHSVSCILKKKKKENHQLSRASRRLPVPLCSVMSSLWAPFASVAMNADPISSLLSLSTHSQGRCATCTAKLCSEVHEAFPESPQPHQSVVFTLLRTPTDHYVHFLCF